MHSHIVSFSLRWFAFILLLYRVTRARDGHTVVVCQFVTCVRAHCSRPSCTARAQERTGKILRKSTKPSSHRIKFEQSTWNSIHCLLGQYAEKKILIFTIRTLHACCVSCVEAQRVNTQMAARKEIQNSFLFLSTKNKIKLHNHRNRSTKNKEAKTISAANARRHHQGQIWFCFIFLLIYIGDCHPFFCSIPKIIAPLLMCWSGQSMLSTKVPSENEAAAANANCDNNKSRSSQTQSSEVEKKKVSLKIIGCSHLFLLFQQSCACVVCVPFLVSHRPEKKKTNKKIVTFNDFGMNEDEATAAADTQLWWKRE